MTDEASEPRAERRWPLVLAVLAVASLPYVTLFAANVGEELDELHLLTWWAVTVGLGGAAAFALGRLPTRAASWSLAVLVIVVYLLFNLPGAVALRDVLGWEISDIVAWWWLAGAVLLVAVPLLRWRTARSFVAIVAPLLLVTPTLQWVVELATQPDASGHAGPPAIADDLVLERDVWYFVLDGLASTDFVLEHAGHDGTDFVAALEDRGFDVQRAAESNYPLTILSVGSALDLEYVYDGFEEPHGASYFERLQGHNRVVDTILANGWSYAHTYPGFWRGSLCSGREQFCFGANGPLTDTEIALLDLTPLRALFDTRSGTSVATTNDPAFVVDQVLAAGLHGPTFHFVHLLTPHPPYVRDADCTIREVEMRLSVWGDGAEYGAAVACLNDQLTRAVDRILEVQADPVIVIQGDHGPRFGVDRSVEGGVVYAEDMFFSIFSAVRLPAECNDIHVPDDLTPVNTFRIVIACLRGEQPTLLPNERYPIHRP